MSTTRHTKSHPSAHTNNSGSGLSWSHLSKNCWSRYSLRLCTFTLLCCSISSPHLSHTLWGWCCALISSVMQPESESVEPYAARGGKRIGGYKRTCMAGCCGQTNHQVQKIWMNKCCLRWKSRFPLSPLCFVRKKGELRTCKECSSFPAARISGQAR